MTTTPATASTAPSPIRPLLLEGVSAALESSEGPHDTFRVTGRRGSAVLPRPLVTLLLLFDGARNLDAIDAAAAELGMKFPSDDFVEMFARQLTKAGIVQLLGQPRATFGRYHYACKMCGSSCMGTPVGPLSEERAEVVEEQWEELVRLVLLPEHQRPITRDEQGRPYLARHGGRCTFLLPDMRCLIHHHFGFKEKPIACRLFPLIATEVDGEIRLAMSTRCDQMHQTFDTSEVYDAVALYEAFEAEGDVRPMFRRYADSSTTDADRQHHQDFTHDSEGDFERALVRYIVDHDDLSLSRVIAFAARAEVEPTFDGPLPDVILDDLRELARTWARLLTEGASWPENIQPGTRRAGNLEAAAQHLIEAELPRAALEALPARWQRYLDFRLRSAFWVRQGYRQGTVRHALLFFALGAAISLWCGRAQGDSTEGYHRFGETVVAYTTAASLTDHVLALLSWRDRDRLLKRWSEALA